MNRTDRVLHNPDRSCATYIRSIETLWKVANLGYGSPNPL